MSANNRITFIKGPLRGVTARIITDFGSFLTVLGGPGILCVSED